MDKTKHDVNKKETGLIKKILDLFRFKEDEDYSVYLRK